MTNKKPVKNNMELWEKVETSDFDSTKPVNDGKRTFTAIDAYAQIKKATELWGAYGSVWLLDDMKFFYNTYDELVLEAVFHYPGGKFPVATDISVLTTKGGKTRDTHKKLMTDAITKSLSYLGFNADVFLGRFDDNKYVEALKSDFEKERLAKEEAEKTRAAQDWTNEFLKKLIDLDHEKVVQLVKDNEKFLFSLKNKYPDLYKIIDEAIEDVSND